MKGVNRLVASLRAIAAVGSGGYEVEGLPELIMVMAIDLVIAFEVGKQMEG